jgi:hypothetical protein
LKKDVSIILVNYHTETEVNGCVASIVEHTRQVDYEVILVDNGSSDGAWDRMARELPAVRVFHQEENEGFGSANNRGAREAFGDYLFFLNPDTTLIDNAVGRFFTYLQDEVLSVAACGGALVYPDGKPAPAWGNLPTFRLCVADLGFRRLFPEYYRRRLSMACPAPEEGIREVPYIIGADIFIRRSAFEKVGGFDERFFLYYEDADLFKRLQMNGLSARILPDAVIIHAGSSSTEIPGQFNYTKYSWLEKGKYLYFEKYRSRRLIFFLKFIQVLTLFIHAPFARPRYHAFRLAALTLTA